MRTDSLWGADCFEELIKYIYAYFLGGFEDAITMVAEELRGFGERGTSPYHVIATISRTLDFSTSTVPCGRKGKSNNTIREYYDDCNILLKRYCDDSSDVNF